MGFCSLSFSPIRSVSLTCTLSLNLVFFPHHCSDFNTALHHQRLGLFWTLVGSHYVRSPVVPSPGHLYVFIRLLSSLIIRRLDSSPAFRLFVFLWHQFDRLPNSVAGFPTLAHAVPSLDISDSLSFSLCFFCSFHFANG